MKDKRLVDATIQDLLEALKPVMREEIKDASDLISKGDAAALIKVKPSTITYYIKKGELTDFNGNVSRSQVLKLYSQSNKAA